MTELKRFYHSGGMNGVSGLWTIETDRLIMEGQKYYLENTVFTQEQAEAPFLREEKAAGDYGPLRAEARLQVSPERVCMRDDTLTNVSSEVQTVFRANARFFLPGGEYEVYTQRSSWSDESDGGWAPLVSRTGVWNKGLRSTEGATPMLALWNRQNNTGVVFHVFSNCAWKITAATERESGDAQCVIVEAGISDRGLRIPLAPGETLALPKIVYYTFRNKTDLECARLHNWFNRLWPRRQQPVIFNTWMMCFDFLHTDKIIEEAGFAAKAGAEYFVIDAGWFGDTAKWTTQVGSWTENLQGGFRGRMREAADKVRALGMKFGLWLEPERARKGTPLPQAHPDWFFWNGTEYITDFGNPEAVRYFTELVFSLIEKYGIEFIKFDFNTSLIFDPTGSNFLRWHQGHETFLRAIREKYPDIYLCCCASGGNRTELYTSTLFDSHWISDNQSCYAQARIVKESLLRLPACVQERWPVLSEAGGFPTYSQEGTSEKILSCDDSNWLHVRSVTEGWLTCLLTGGVFGISFSLSALNEEHRETVRLLVDRFKRIRGDLKDAPASLLCDGEKMTVWEQTGQSGDIYLCAFCWRHHQRTVTVYPHADPHALYSCDGKVFSGSALREEGISLTVPRQSDAVCVCLKRL